MTFKLFVPALFFLQFLVAEGQSPLTTTPPAEGEFSLPLGTITVDPAIAQQECPNQWQQVISCVVSECPSFADACNPEPLPATEDAFSCEAFQTGMCQQYNTPGCCMMGCMESLFALSSCLVMKTSGEDISDCAAITEDCIQAMPEEMDPMMNITITGEEYLALLDDIDALAASVQNLRGRLQELAGEAPIVDYSAVEKSGEHL